MRKYKPVWSEEVDLDNPETYLYLPNTYKELRAKMFSLIGYALVYMDYFPNRQGFFPKRKKKDKFVKMSECFPDFENDERLIEINNVAYNQRYTVYYKDLPGDKILAFLKYTWDYDTFSRFFIKDYEGKKIDTAYDLSGIEITCHAGVKVFGARWDIKNTKDATWISRVTQIGTSEKAISDYLKKISKNIKVNSVVVKKNNEGFHSYNCDLYDVIVEVSIVKANPKNVKISKMLEDFDCEKYFKDENKVYFISERRMNPRIFVATIEEDIIMKLKSEYNSSKKFLGNKIQFV